MVAKLYEIHQYTHRPWQWAEKKTSLWLESVQIPPKQLCGKQKEGEKQVYEGILRKIFPQQGWESDKETFPVPPLRPIISNNFNFI